jgi:hypothetical protein
MAEALSCQAMAQLVQQHDQKQRHSHNQPEGCALPALIIQKPKVEGCPDKDEREGEVHADFDSKDSE